MDGHRADVVDMPFSTIPDRLSSYFNEKPSDDVMRRFSGWLTNSATKEKSEKSAKQHVYQVLKFLSLVKGPTFYKGSENWFNISKRQYKPGTITSQLSSIRLYTDFIRYTDLFRGASPRCLDTISGLEMQLGVWQKNAKSDQKIREKEIGDRHALLMPTPDEISKFCNSKFIADMNCELDQSPTDVDKDIWTTELNAHTRDYLITIMAMINASRKGNVCNLSLGEFKARQRVNKKMVCVSVKLVKNRKFTGSANVIITNKLELQTNNYIKRFRRFCFKSHTQATDESRPLFVTKTGWCMADGTSSKCFGNTWKRAIGKYITATIFRKAVVDVYHSKKSHLAMDLAKLMGHSFLTAEKHYRVTRSAKKTAKMVKSVINTMRINAYLGSSRSRRKNRSKKNRSKKKKSKGQTEIGFLSFSSS
jgi:hypothetical protein